MLGQLLPFSLSLYHIGLIISLFDQIHDAPQDPDQKVSLGHHDLQRAELSRRVPQPGCGHQVREQEHHDQAVQQLEPSLLAAEFPGRVHVEFAVRRGEE
jgi:hypothetical protein